MYYILNQHNQIIAADNDLLTLCEAKHLDDLLLQTIQDKTSFIDLSQESISIKTHLSEDTFLAKRTILSSMLGEMTLITLSSPATIEEEEKIEIEDKIEIESNEPIDEEVLEKLFEEDILKEDITKEDILDNIEEEVIAKEEVAKEEVIEELIKEDIAEDTYSLSDVSLLKDNTFDHEIVENVEEDVAEDLNIDTEEVSFIQNDTSDELATEEDTIDIEKISQEIGISTHDYKLFFNEFIDTAFALEKDLHHAHDEKYNTAITTLSHLSDALHLPTLQKAIKDIDVHKDDAKVEHIDALYRTLANLAETHADTTDTDLPKEESSHVEHHMVELFDDIPKIDLDENVAEVEEVEESKVEVAKTSSEKGFGSLNLDDVEPIHFDFKLEEAAEDLSLPVELIEEFVQDFIEQAHTETDKMLEAYEDGDLETIQKIGHLLKGASSNLRINTLSDTLYNIQFCEDSSNLEDLIKDYWGHFLAFEKQINIISNR